MIKILHIISGLGPGGAQTCLLNLIKNTENISHSVISLGSQDIYHKILNELNVEYFNIPISTNIISIKNFFILSKYIQKCTPDIVQTWLYRADLMGTTANFLTKHKNRIIWSVRCSDMGGRYEKGMNFVLLKLLIRLSKIPDSIVFNSFSGAKFHISSGYSPENAVNISNGIDTEVFKSQISLKNEKRNELNIPENIFLAGYVGRYDDVKGHDDFLNIIKKNLDAWGLMVGDGVTKSSRIREKIKSEKLSDRIRLFEQRNDIPEIMSTFDVFLSASRSEGFPTVIAEAMACEIPIIATNAGDTKKILGSDGFISPIGNINELSNNFLLVKKMSNSERQHLGGKLRKRILDNYSMEQMIKKYQDLYKKLVS